jgi:hypothetical protein
MLQLLDVRSQLQKRRPHRLVKKSGVGRFADPASLPPVARVTNPSRQTPLEPAKTANRALEIKLTPAFSELFSPAAKLAPEDQALVAKGLVSASGDPRYVDSLTKLLASSDFRELSPDDKNAVLTYAKNHSSEIDLDRNWVMKLMLDTGYEERYQEKEVAKFSRHEQDLVHEIETERGCRINEGFKQWLSLRPPAERGFYHVVYAPCLIRAPSAGGTERCCLSRPRYIALLTSNPCWSGSNACGIIAARGPKVTGQSRARCCN